MWCEMKNTFACSHEEPARLSLMLQDLFKFKLVAPVPASQSCPCPWAEAQLWWPEIRSISLESTTVVCLSLSKNWEYPKTNWARFWKIPMNTVNTILYHIHPFPRISLLAVKLPQLHRFPQVMLAPRSWLLLPLTHAFMIDACLLLVIFVHSVIRNMFEFSDFGASTSKFTVGKHSPSAVTPRLESPHSQLVGDGAWVHRKRTTILKLLKWLLNSVKWHVFQTYNQKDLPRHTVTPKSTQNRQGRKHFPS